MYGKHILLIKAQDLLLVMQAEFLKLRIAVITGQLRQVEQLQNLLAFFSLMKIMDMLLEPQGQY